MHLLAIACMNLRKQRTVGLIAGLLVLALSIRAQDLRTRAEENPLSTVFYLLSTTAAHDKSSEKACLATSYARAKRYDEIKNVARLIDYDSYAAEDFAALADRMIQHGAKSEASELIAELVEKFGDEPFSLRMLLRPLVRLGRDIDAYQLFAKFDESERVDAGFELTKIYLELARPADALKAIEWIDPFVARSEYDEEKAELALYYAKLNKDEKALKWLAEAIKHLKWIEGKPEYLDGRILDIAVKIYQALGRSSEANEILRKRGEKPDDPESQSDIARDLLRAEKIAQAKAILERLRPGLNPESNGDSFDLGVLIEIYVRLNELRKAEDLAKQLSGNTYLQQLHLLSIADVYIKKNDRKKATRVLEFALRQTEKIDTNKAEDGRLWTSGKWEQAQYQSQIAIRYADLQLNRRALDLISRLKKPYLKALTLTEFVSVNRKRLPAIKLSPYLEEAFSLLRQEKSDIFDSKRFDVYAITARNFAELGMSKRANEAFAETLTTLDRYVRERSIDTTLLYAMCNIGVDFELSGITADEALRESLRRIIKNWENDEY